MASVRSAWTAFRLRHVGMALRQAGPPERCQRRPSSRLVEDVVSANLSSERHLYKAGP